MVESTARDTPGAAACTARRQPERAMPRWVPPLVIAVVPTAHGEYGGVSEEDIERLKDNKTGLVPNDFRRQEVGRGID